MAAFSGSTYQQFDFLGDLQRKDSDSPAKYACAGLGALDLRGKSVLDIGCNAGYFTMRCAKEGAVGVLGIDTSPKFLEVAENIRKEFFKDRADILFELRSLFDLTVERKFDVVLALSIYHYFVDAQFKALQVMAGSLAPSGILKLEVEECPANTSVIHKACRRAVEGDLDYPTEKKMSEWISAVNLTVLSKVPSAEQRGALFHRYLYTLRA